MAVPQWAQNASLTQPSADILNNGWVDNGDPPCANDMNWILSQLSQQAHVPASISSPAGTLTVSGTGTDGQTFTVDIDFAALAVSPVFRELFYTLFIAGFQQNGDDLVIADGTDGAGNPTFTPCP